jgi:SAM-dependent methyltransferase
LRSAGKTLFQARNFYGTLQVTESGTEAMTARALYNGTILHGIEFSAPGRSRLTTTYYGPQSGAGLVLQSRLPSQQRAGVIGLGVGTLAAYGRAGDYFRFYEINPAVIRIASGHFRFLKESEARTEIVAGDGRLALEREPEQNVDVLVLDAFSGDAIPVHLLTQQAFEIYFRHLRPGGIIAVHVTNKYLDLASVVQNIAASLRKQALFIHSAADRQRPGDQSGLGHRVIHVGCRHQPIRRVHIPKEKKGQTRPIGISATEDKVVQNALREVLAGKRIVLVDDSIVRGTTSLKIVQMMRDAGAREVHMRIASPPITHSDYYGIDTPERDKLLAANHDIEGMRAFIGADSLAFLSVPGIYRAMGVEARDPVRPQFTDHCFTGDYPTPLTDLTGERGKQQLSLLAEAG